MIRFSDEEFQRLVTYVAEHYGIDLSKKRALAECRLSLELDQLHFTTLHEFLDHLETDRTGRLASLMMNRLTTNYTFFLRESSHFEFLEQEILPTLSHSLDSFRIWCAGCSTGEECYTLAMWLAAYRDNGGWLPPVQILGTDLSELVLNKAQAARYPSGALEKLPSFWRRAYCKMDGKDHFVIREEVRQMVEFRKMNLMRPYAGHGVYDLILCRNVMIYFHEKSRRQLTQNLSKSLKDGGYLFIGHTELLSRDQTLFTYVCPAIYRKMGKDRYEEG